MADETRRIEVVANTQPEAQQLKRAFDWVQQQQKELGKPTPTEPAGKQAGGGTSWFGNLRSSAVGMLKKAISEPLRGLGPPGRVAAAAATTPPTEWAGRIRDFVQGMVWGIILDPFSELGAAGRLITAGLMTFGKPLIMGALKLPFTLGKAGAAAFGAVGAVAGIGIGIGVAAAALAFVVRPLINLGITYKILKTSYRWAEEVTDQQMRVYGRTRRTFPGVIGQAFEGARQTTWAKLQVVSGLFGESADAMWYGFTRRMQMAQRGGSAAGAKDMFADLGITPQAVRQYEEMRGGERLGLNDMLFLFIRRREVLDAQIMAAGEGTPARAILLQRKAKLLDSATRLFGINFADMVGAFNSHDLRQLNYALMQAAPLGAPSDAENAQQNVNNFKIASESLKYTFGQIKEGIVGSVQPIFTSIMENVRSWLFSTAADGETMAAKLRNLGSSLAIHAWKSLQVLLEGISVEGVRAFVSLFTGWNPKQDIDRLLKLGHLLKLLFTPLAWLFKWVLWVFDKAKKLDKLLGGPISKGAGILGGIAKGIWGAGETAGVWYKAYRAAGGGAMGRAAARRAVGMYQAGIPPGGAGPAATGPGAGGRYGALQAGQAGYSGGVKILGGETQKVEPKSLYSTLVQRFRASKLHGYVPPDGAKWGITTGSAEEWARLGTALAHQESGMAANPRSEPGNPQGRAGLYQFGWKDLKSRGLGTDVTNVNAQITAMIGEFENIKTTGSVTGSGRQGAARYFGPFRRPWELLRHMPKAERAALEAGAVPLGGAAGGAGATGEWASATRGAEANQAARPHNIGGTVEIGGKIFNWGSGGRGRGAIPYGTHNINIVGQGGILGPRGPSLGSVATVGGRGGEIWDPKLGATRAGIQIHPSGSSAALDRLYTAGCFGVPRDQWPAFKATILQEAAKHPGGLALSIGRNGRAFVGPRSQFGKVQPTSTPTNEAIKQAQESSQPAAPPAAIPTEAKARAPKPVTAAVDVDKKKKVEDIDEARMRLAKRKEEKQKEQAMLTEKSSKDVTDQAKKAADVAADRFKRKIADTSIPITLPKEKDRDSAEKVREAERQAA